MLLGRERSVVSHVPPCHGVQGGRYLRLQISGQAGVWTKVADGQVLRSVMALKGLVSPKAEAVAWGQGSSAQGSHRPVR